MTLLESLRSKLIEAFHASRITNAEFAKRCGLNEAAAFQLVHTESHPDLVTIERAIKALDKRIEIRILPLALAMTLLPSLAFGQLPYAAPQCTVAAHLVINTYIGPIEITDVCMTTGQYTGGFLEFIGVDLADGIFRDGFDGAQP